MAPNQTSVSPCLYAAVDIHGDVINTMSNK